MVGQLFQFPISSLSKESTEFQNILGRDSFFKFFVYSQLLFNFFRHIWKRSSMHVLTSKAHLTFNLNSMDLISSSLF